MTDEEKRYFQSVINDVYEQFVNHVVEVKIWEEFAFYFKGDELWFSSLDWIKFLTMIPAFNQKEFFLMIRRPPRSTRKESSAASDVYKRQVWHKVNLQKFKTFILKFRF